VYRKRTGGYLSYNNAMATKLTPAGVFAKWVVAPLILVLIGYFLLGPRIGKSMSAGASATKDAQEGPANADPPTPATTVSTDQPSSGPDVDVTVQPAGSAANHPHSLHAKHKKPVPKPAEDGAPATEHKPHANVIQPDEAGNPDSSTAG